MGQVQVADQLVSVLADVLLRTRHHSSIKPRLADEHVLWQAADRGRHRGDAIDGDPGRVTARRYVAQVNPERLTVSPWTWPRPGTRG